MTTLPLLDIMARETIDRIQRERLSLLPRQFGRPDNRRRMAALTHQQLGEELKR
jgi:hypothetical protein